MFAFIRRRWPVLTTVVIGFAYLANNYSISGLQQLRLKPVERPEVNNRSPDFGYGSFDAFGGTGFDLTQLGIQGLSLPGNEMGLGLPPLAGGFTYQTPGWNESLSAGERLAIWQDNIDSSSGRNLAVPAGQFTSNLPNTSPIPMPTGLPMIDSTPSSAFGKVVPNGDHPPFAFSSLTGSEFATQADSSLRKPDLTALRDLLSATEQSHKRRAMRLADFGTHALMNGAGSFRLATFKVSMFDANFLSQPRAFQALVAILQQYELIALQGIQSTRDDLLPLIVERLNQAGGGYDYLIGPRVGRGTMRQQFAFIFDTRILETDRYQLYTVDDPQDLVNYEPLVAWFRCKPAPAKDAFTFSIANISIDPHFADAERDLLPAMIDAMEKDGRHEDDWILAGDFAGDASQLAMLQRKHARFAVHGMATDVAGTQMLDTIVFSSRASSEYTGRSGVFDFLRKYNLSIEQATEISSHLPAWAEFSCIEGFQPGRIAPADPQAVF